MRKSNRARDKPEQIQYSISVNKYSIIWKTVLIGKDLPI